MDQPIEFGDQEANSLELVRQKDPRARRMLLSANL